MSLVITTEDKFKEEIATGKVLVDFYADWCGPCQMIAPILEEVAKEQEDVKIVKLNVDNAASIAGEYRVMSIPTMILFENGEVKDQKVGVVSKEDIINWIA